MAPTPGLLYVTMQPQENLSVEAFHDWYNNEHGPTRLRLPFVVNGFRYKATDLNGPGEGMPEWLAWYDITDMAELTKETYTRLRLPGVKSQRETETMNQIKVNRKLFDFIEGRQSPDFKMLEDISSDSHGTVMISVSFRLKPGEDKVDELHRWYREEHIDLLSKVPGWLCSRRFVTSSVTPDDPVEYMALHEYAPTNGLGGPEFQAAISTPWAKRVHDGLITGRTRRTYELYYIFGPAPRNLAISTSWTAPDRFTTTTPSSGNPNNLPSLTSYITTSDNVTIPYTLTGSTSPSAPLILLSNSILVEWDIWDAFLTSFFSRPQNTKFRILRYHTRGRYASFGSQPVTLDLLASDAIALLNALRVPRAAALIGVSLGGATVLNAALKYSDRVGTFVSCDTNAVAPAGNRKAWGDRAAVAEKEDAVGGKEAIPGGKESPAIVGHELAKMTVERWFASEDGKMEAEMERVGHMVACNSLEGFKGSVQALFEYDLREEMKSASVKGAFVVGAKDGALPATMQEMAESYGKGAVFREIQGAGHLPMVEKPDEFAEFVTSFLEEGE